MKNNITAQLIAKCHDCEGRKRSGKNGSTLGLAAAQRSAKRSVKAKTDRILKSDFEG